MNENNDIETTKDHSRNMPNSIFSVILEKLTTLETKLTTIDSKMNNINSRLDTIETVLKGPLQENTEKMKHHIDFVEDVYETVRNPLTFVCNKVNSLVYSTSENTGYISSNLPSLEHKNTGQVNE